MISRPMISRPMISGDMKLSPHFTLAELIRSETALRRGLDNRPPPAAIENLVRLARQVLEPVRERYGIPFSPSSGYRCPALNRAVGGRAGSQHVRGEAVDFRLPGVPLGDLARWIRDHLVYDQLILEQYRAADPAHGWIHCSRVGEAAENRREALIFDGTAYRRL